MNIKIMEGLVGAGTNRNLMNTPMRVYKEAESKGDTATMERAMGYVNDFSNAADEYRSEADKGLEEDVKAAREKAKSECEEAARRIREKAKSERKDTAGKSKEEYEKTEDGTNEAKAGEVKADDAKEPVTYTKTGEEVPMEQSANISVLV